MCWLAAGGWPSLFRGAVEGLPDKCNYLHGREDGKPPTKAIGNYSVWDFNRIIRWSSKLSYNFLESILLGLEP